MKWINEYNQYLDKLMDELAKQLQRFISEEPLHVTALYTVSEGKRQGYKVASLLASNPEDLNKAKEIIQELFQSGFLEQTDYNQAMTYIGSSERWYDFVIQEAVVWREKEQIVEKIVGVGVEAKTAATNKGAFVAELIRDMYNVLKGVPIDEEGRKLTKVVVTYPDDPSMRKWVGDTVNAVARKFESKFGVEYAGGALGEGALVEFGSKTTFKQWLGAKVQTLLDFMSGTRALGGQ